MTKHRSVISGIEAGVGICEKAETGEASRNILMTEDDNDKHFVYFGRICTLF